MSIVVFDTETTGVKPSDNIVQLAYRIVDKDRNLILERDTLIKQDKPIPPEATAIHGKTDAMCAEFGIDLGDALNQFMRDTAMCDAIVAHNISFDKRMIINDSFHAGIELVIPTQEICTMRIFTDICKIPPTEKMINAGRNHYKSPSVMEAYIHVFGKRFDNAHDALADVKACEALYFWYLDFGGKKELPQKKTANKATKKDLAVIEEGAFIALSKPAIELFTEDGIKHLKELVELKIASFAETPLNMDEKKERDKLRSFSANIASFKVGIEKMGKSLLDDMKKPIEEQEKKIKATRGMVNKCVEMLQTLQNATRKPLTEYEEAEKARIDKIKSTINGIKALEANSATLNLCNLFEVERALRKLKEIYENYDFEEFSDEAHEVFMCVKENLEGRVSFLKREAELKVKEQELEKQRIAQEIEAKANALAQQKVIEAEVQKRVASATQDVAPRPIYPAMTETVIRPIEIDPKTINTRVMLALKKYTDMPTAMIITKAILGGEIPHISISYGG